MPDEITTEDVSGKWWLELPGGQLTQDHQLRVQSVLQQVHSAAYNESCSKVHLVTAELRQLRMEGGDGPAIRAKQLEVREATRDRDQIAGMYYDHAAMWQDITAAWVVNRGPYTGTLPKRVAAWLRRRKLEEYDNRNMVFAGTAKALAALGAELGPHVNHGTRYVCDVVPHMQWRSGDFGDSGSCFWNSGRNCVRAMFTRLGSQGKFAALRFYSPTIPSRGIGRALCTYVERHGLWVVTNAYGVALLTAARVLSHALGLNYVQLPCVNEGRTDGNVYVNSGNCFVLYPLDAPKPRMNTIELGVQVTCEDYTAARELAPPRRCPGGCGQYADDCGTCDDCGHWSCCCDCNGDDYDRDDDDGDEEAEDGEVNPATCQCGDCRRARGEA